MQSPVSGFPRQPRLPRHARVAIAPAHGLARLEVVVAADVVAQQPLREHEARGGVAVGAMHAQRLARRLRRTRARTQGRSRWGAMGKDFGMKRSEIQLIEHYLKVRGVC
eukprot:6205318-Pleurochrysis_carterae.AAC.1